MPRIVLQGEPQGQTLLVKFLMLQGQMALHGFSVATKLPQSHSQKNANHLLGAVPGCTHA